MQIYEKKLKVKLRKMTIASYVLGVTKLNLLNVRTIQVIRIKINYKNIKYTFKNNRIIEKR